MKPYFITCKEAMEARLLLQVRLLEGPVSGGQGDRIFHALIPQITLYLDTLYFKQPFAQSILRRSRL